MSSFKIGHVSHFPILSHGLSLNTITNALTRVLQSVNKRKKDIQCYQLKVVQCSQHKFVSLICLCFHYFVHPLHTGFEVLTAGVMKSTICWDITPCSLFKVNRRFGGIYLATCFMPVSWSAWGKDVSLQFSACLTVVPRAPPEILRRSETVDSSPRHFLTYLRLSCSGIIRFIALGKSG
jgi:hypothetical protein